MAGVVTLAEVIALCFGCGGLRRRPKRLRIGRSGLVIYVLLSTLGSGIWRLDCETSTPIPRNRRCMRWTTYQVGVETLVANLCSIDEAMRAVMNLIVAHG